MKKTFILLMATIINASIAFCVQSKIFVPSGLEVPVKFKETYSTQTITVETKIPITIANDVYYKNTLIFPKGSAGYMYPTYVKKAKVTAGSFGKIKFESAYIKDINGNEQLIVVNKEFKPQNYSFGEIAFSWDFMSKDRREVVLSEGQLMIGKTVNEFPVNIK